MRPVKKKLEKDVQSSVIDQLTEWGWYVLKVISCNKGGHPDLNCFRAGKAVFIEMKRPANKKRPDEHLQEFRQEELRRLGFEVFIARGLADIAHMR